MEIIVSKINSNKNISDGKIIMAFEGENPLEETNYPIKNEEFNGKFLEIKTLNLALEEKPNKIIFIGLGKRDEINHEKIRKAIGKSIKESNKLNIKNIEVSTIGIDKILTLNEFSKIISETAILANYKFDKYLSNKNKTKLEKLNIVCNEDDYDEINKSINEGKTLGEATNLARNLVNEPSNILTPIKLSEEVDKAGKEYGFDVEVYDEKEIKKFGMEAYLEVSKGSINPPRFIVMKYFGDKDNEENIVGLVGKGLTYDSGGLSLKPNSGMVNMKTDMAGSAAVIGAIAAIAKMELKINVIGAIAACENMISSKAYKPGDIINTMAGKTILVNNTDAEGRLTLVDGVYYLVEKENVNKILDIATLTGAAQRAFGNHVTAVLSNDDTFYRELEKATEESGEMIARAPILDEYRKLIKPDIADLTNSSKGPGMITAGIFISEFVKGKPWIHMDIAGTSWSEEELEYIPKGGTGVGVRTIYYLLKENSN